MVLFISYRKIFQESMRNSDPVESKYLARPGIVTEYIIIFTMKAAA